MQKVEVARKVVVWASGGATLWAFLQAILILGVDKKSFFQIFADIIGGGATGALIGLLFFLVFGAIGWVTGALYGAIGLLSLMFGGALGGLGLGSLIHMARNPSHYNFNWLVIIVGIFIAYHANRWVTQKIGNLYDKHGSLLIHKLTGPKE